MLSDLLEIMVRMMSPLLIVLLVLIVINIVVNYIKYGKNIFSSFRNYDESGKMKDIAINILNQECKNEIMIIDRDDNSFYSATKHGIYAVLMLEPNYDLSGRGTDEYLISNNKKIVNPIPKFLNDVELVKGQKVNIIPLIVNTRKDLMVNITDIHNADIITLKDFCYKIYCQQHSDTNYQNSEMYEICVKIKGIFNGNH